VVVPADTERTVAVEAVVLDLSDHVLVVTVLDDRPASHLLVSKLSHRIVLLQGWGSDDVVSERLLELADNTGCEQSHLYRIDNLTISSPVCQ
jgi:hypothetical protein